MLQHDNGHGKHQMMQAVPKGNDHRLNRRRNANGEKLLADGFAQLHPPQAEPVSGFHTAQVPHGEQRRQPLGTGGGQSSALYTPIQKVDKFGSHA